MRVIWGLFWGKRQKGIESLEKIWNDCVATEGDYVDE